MARIAQDPEVRRREILDAAEKLFEQKGFQRTTISDIAQAMNVAQGMLYYYFKSKEELLGALVHRQGVVVMAETKQKPDFASGTPQQKIGMMMSALLSSACAHDSVLLRALFDERNAHIRDRVNRQIEQSISECLKEIIEEGVQDGSFQVVDTEAVLNFILKFGEVMIEAMQAKLSRQQVVVRLRLAEQLLETLLGLKPKTMRLTLSL